MLYLLFRKKKKKKKQCKEDCGVLFYILFKKISNANNYTLYL